MKKPSRKSLHPKTMIQKIRKVGAVPGEVVFTGEQKLDTVQIYYMEYNSSTFFEEAVTGQSFTTYHEPDDSVMQWYDIRGLHNTQLIQEIGQVFSIHPLVLEDVADTYQRPKFEEFEQGNFITLKKIHWQENQLELDSQQVSIYFGDGFLISFQEDERDTFANVKTRIKQSSGRIRKRGADYLAYALIDTLIDNYFTILDDVEQFIEQTEYEINIAPKDNIKSTIHDVKMEMVQMRKNVVPLRDAIGKFSRSESKFIREDSLPFIQDVYDHSIQITDMVESSRDSLTNLQELYMSEVSFRMNQIMKVLTVVTTVFIPLSFLTGLYGMNFTYMPELNYKYGYFILLGVMFVIVISLLVYFKRKDWL